MAPRSDRTGAVPRKNILLTGSPGVGKTTVVRRVLEALSVPAGGFFTRELRDARGARSGFALVTTAGREVVLSHVDFATPHRVGKYGVRVEAMDEVGVAALVEAAEGAARIVVIDEIAKMELFSGGFRAAAERCLDGPKPVLAVIQQSRLPFLDALRARVDVEVLPVTVATRDELPRRIAERLQRLLEMGSGPPAR